MRRSFYIAVAAAMLAATPIFAQQDKPTPPPKEFKPELQPPRKTMPSLNLPEYVITGSDVIIYSGYSKENIAVHDPEEFQRRAGRGVRESWYGDPSPIKAPLNPEPLPGNEYFLLAQAGYGNFSTPYAEVWYSQHYDRGDLRAHAAFESSDGHVSESDYSDIGIDVMGGSYFSSDLPDIIRRSRIQGDLSYEHRDYGLYGNDVLAVTPDLLFRRTYSTFDLGMDLVSRKNRLFDYNARVFTAYTSFDEEMFATNVDTSVAASENTEQTIGMNLGAVFHTEHFPIHLHTTIQTTDISETDTSSTNPLYFAIGADAEWMIGGVLNLRAGLEFLAWENSDETSHSTLHPSVYASYAVTGDVDIFGAFEPSVSYTTSRSLYERNPYFALGSVLRSQDKSLNFKLGAGYDDRKFISLRGYIQYSEIEDYTRFVQEDIPVHRQWGVEYDGRSTITSLHAETKVRFSEKNYVLGEAVYRSSENDLTGEAIPYLPDYELSAVYSHDIIERLNAQVSAKLLGTRLADAEELSAVLNLGIEGSYWMTENVGAFVRLRNFFDENYQLYQGYDARPLFVMGGLKARL